MICALAAAAGSTRSAARPGNPTIYSGVAASKMERLIEAFGVRIGIGIETDKEKNRFRSQLRLPTPNISQDPDFHASPGAPKSA
jgi:hypothetical protein